MSGFSLIVAQQGVEQVARDTLDSSQRALVDSFRDAFIPLVQMAPKAIAAVVVLAIGFLVAKWLGRMVVALGETLGLQRAAERSGLAESMRQMNIRRGVPALMGLIVFWLLMCVSIMAAFKILGLQVISDTMQQVVNYIPNLLVATVVVVVGLLLASFLRGLVATSASRLGISYAEQLANGCYYVLALMTFIAAFQQLKIEFALLEQVILITFAALGLAFGLAVGLGGRDVVGGILAGYYIRQRFHPGDQVLVSGYEGTVREVGPVSTIVETEEGGLLHRHSIPNHIMLKEAIR